LNFSAIFKYLYLSLYYRELSPTFRSDIGYIERNDLKIRGISINPTFYLHKFLINAIHLNFNYEKEENLEKISKEEWFTFSYHMDFLFAQTNLGIFYSKNANSNIFNIYTLNYSKFKNTEWKSFWMTLAPFKFLFLSFSNSEGDVIFYELDKIVYQRDLSISNFLNFTKLQISFNIQKQIFYDKKNKFLEAEVFSFRTSYSFTQRTSLRVLLTYYKNSIGIYPLFTYQINPFSFLYFGLNQKSYEYGEFLSPKKLEGQRHQFFVKIQHFFNF
jgi:hypothetical protein